MNEVPCPVFLFAKPPRAGVSKTRLAVGVGDEVAVQFARAFLVDTIAALRSLPWAEPILATTEVNADFGLTKPTCVDQGGGSLGDRLHRVLRRGIEDRGVAFAIGADSPGLPLSLVEAAHRALAEVDATFVATEDGGFALLGLRVCPSTLFAGIRWSAATTLTELEAQMDALRMTHRRVGHWFDIDEVSDLHQFKEAVLPEAAPATWAVLRSTGMGL